MGACTRPLFNPFTTGPFPGPIDGVPARKSCDRPLLHISPKVLSSDNEFEALAVTTRVFMRDQ